uniref:Uncharacterized protein n=1 Tax=Schistocephalus solidus TaxID=70667 RepID=A0A0X3PY50_SCHSO
MDDDITQPNASTENIQCPSPPTICTDREQDDLVINAVNNVVGGSTEETYIFDVVSARDVNNCADSDDWSPPHSEEIRKISEEDFRAPPVRPTKSRISRPPPPSISLFPPTIISTSKASLRDSKYGPRWSYPGVGLQYSNKEYIIQLSLPTCDTTCQLVISFYRLNSAIANRDAWNSWCKSHKMPEMGAAFREFHHAHRVGSEKRQLQAVRHKFNVDLAVSDIYTSPMSNRMHRVTIFAQTKDTAVTAMASLLSSLPTDLQGKSIVAIDHVFADSRSMRPPMFSFVSQ